MKAPKNTKVQSLLFCREHFTMADAKAWAKKHGYKSRDVYATEKQIHLRQQDPSLFQPGYIRTIPFGQRTGIQAVIGRPWIPVLGNPHPKNEAETLANVIHKDWSLHRQKHAIYARLAKSRAAGNYNRLVAETRFKPLVKKAVARFMRDHKVKRVKASQLFSERMRSDVLRLLVEQFDKYFRQGQLDQHFARKDWHKRKEPK